MKVYRIASAKYADDVTGEGSKIFGGRWNHKGVACIYTSESRALALLEYTVNINIYEIPRALYMITFEIQDNVKSISESVLPGNWKNYPAPNETKDFGSKFLQSAEHAAIQIPSSIITDEYNYILNPLYKNSKQFKIVNMKDFIYDVRIKRR